PEALRGPRRHWRARARIGAVPKRRVDKGRSAPADPRDVLALRSPARAVDYRRCAGRRRRGVGLRGAVSGRLPLVGWVTVLTWRNEPEVARREDAGWRLFGFQT